MQIVNGIPCQNCTDVERAKKAAPGDSGALDRNPALDVTRLLKDFASGNAPLDFGDRGRTINLGA
jgi:hypothetical protein